MWSWIDVTHGLCLEVVRVLVLSSASDVYAVADPVLPVDPSVPPEVEDSDDLERARKWEFCEWFVTIIGDIGVWFAWWGRGWYLPRRLSTVRSLDWFLIAKPIEYRLRSDGTMQDLKKNGREIRIAEICFILIRHALGSSKFYLSLFRQKNNKKS